MHYRFRDNLSRRLQPARTRETDSRSWATATSRGVKRARTLEKDQRSWATETSRRLKPAAQAVGHAGWLLAITLVLGVAPKALRAEVTIRDPGSYVVDRAGIIDDRVERQLEGWLRELEQKTTAQVKVLTVSSTDGEDVFGFVQRHAELWKLGRKGKDNGVLIVVVPKSPGQKGIVRIQPGYGFEATMPDSWCGSLARGIRDQYLKKNR
ncbi:MAG: TPM domain-containing protein [Planctomycetes bacterium]|nr:TPM domain-containing protein [Planctomycetota bacterium]